MNSLLSILASIGEFTHFAWQALVAAVLAFAKPQAWLQQLYSVLIGALPLATVAGIALGAVVWMHTYAALSRARAVEYSADRSRRCRAAGIGADRRWPDCRSANGGKPRRRTAAR